MTIACDAISALTDETAVTGANTTRGTSSKAPAGSGMGSTPQGISLEVQGPKAQEDLEDHDGPAAGSNRKRLSSK